MKVFQSHICQVFGTFPGQSSEIMCNLLETSQSHQKSSSPFQQFTSTCRSLDPSNADTRWNKQQKKRAGIRKCGGHLEMSLCRHEHTLRFICKIFLHIWLHPKSQLKLALLFFTCCHSSSYCWKFSERLLETSQHPFDFLYTLNHRINGPITNSASLYCFQDLFVRLTLARCVYVCGQVRGKDKWVKVTSARSFTFWRQLVTRFRFKMFHHESTYRNDHSSRKSGGYTTLDFHRDTAARQHRLTSLHWSSGDHNQKHRPTFQTLNSNIWSMKWCSSTPSIVFIL